MSFSRSLKCGSHRGKICDVRRMLKCLPAKSLKLIPHQIGSNGTGVFTQKDDSVQQHSRAGLILQASRRFTYVTALSPTLPSLYVRHSSFSNPSVASPTSQLILQPFFRFSYVTGFHLRHLASRPCLEFLTCQYIHKRWFETNRKLSSRHQKNINLNTILKIKI